MPVKLLINKNGHCRLCHEPDTFCDLVACDECDRWFHQSCVKLPRKPHKNERWICPKCAEIETVIRELEARNTSPKPQEHFMMPKKSMEELITSIKHLKVEPQPNQNDWQIYLKRQALLSLPKFYGSPKEWPKFKKVYEETTKAGEFSNLENLTRLQQVLEGNAKKAVQALMLDPENVSNVMDRLEEIYGRPDLIHKELVMELRKIRKESRTCLIETTDALENLTNNLKIIQKEDYLYDIRLVEEIVSKLPYNIQVKWVEFMQQNEVQDRSLSLEDLGQWLKPFSRLTLS